MNVLGSGIHAAAYSLYELNHAILTQMKFTRSFPAKAAAREKVPINTIIFGIFHFKID